MNLNLSRINLNLSRNTIIGIVVAVVILGAFSLFTVNEAQTAIRFRLGEIVQTDYEPGLHFKVPFINNIRKFDARVQTLDLEPERFLTAEKKNVIVDAFVKWRIGEVDRFYTAVAGDYLQANLRLDQIVKDGLRSEFSKRTLKEVVSGERVQIMEVLSALIVQEARQLGIDAVDVRIKRIDLPDAVTSSVYERMRSERERVAREFRSQGAEAAERIQADADRRRTVLLAEAYRDAERLRGEGDARAADIYAQAYGQEADFYRFHRSLNAYRNSFSSKDDLIVLQPDSDFFRYFNNLKIPE